MKRTSKIVIFLVLAVFLFSAVATANAAVVGKDAVGTKYEDAVNKLAALKILRGYEDLSVKPDQTITRAEFAALAIQELGLSDQIGEAPTQFKDVPSSHWASGIVNLAAGKGIVKGFPDGTFRPNEKVTYAQAAAMLVQMLGWGPAVDGKPYPSAVLYKAADLDISKGVTMNASAAANRGDVFIMAANALESDLMDQTSFGDNNDWTKTGHVPLTKYFDVTLYDGKITKYYDDLVNREDYLRVDNVPRIDIKGLEANEIEFTKKGTTFVVSEQYNPNDFLGEEVEAWINDDDEVLWISNSGNEKVVVGEIDYIDFDKNEVTLTNGKDYDLNTSKDGVQVYFNLKDYSDAEDIDEEDYEDAQVKLMLSDKSKVVTMVCVNYYYSASDQDTLAGVVTEVNKEEITYYDTDGNEDELDLDGEDYIVMRNGEVAAVSDIEEDDVINILKKKNDEYYVVATSDVVSGKVTKVAANEDSNNINKWDIYIDGTKYDVQDAIYAKDKKDPKAIKVSDIKDLYGEEVTLFLNAVGDIAYVASGDIANSDLIGVVVKSVQAGSGFNKDEVKLTIFNKAGKELSWTFEYDDVKLAKGDDAGYVEPVSVKDWTREFTINSEDDLHVVEYKLTKDGDLDKVRIRDWDYRDDWKVDEDDMLVGDFNVDDNTVFFDVTGLNSVADEDIDDLAIVSWNSMKKYKEIEAYLITDKNDLDYAFVVSADGDTTIVSDAMYGIVTAVESLGDDDGVTILTKDGKKTYVVDPDDVELGKLSKGQFVRYELDADDEIDELQVLVNITKRNKANEATDYKVTIKDYTSKQLTKLNIDDAKLIVVEEKASNSLKDNDGKYYNIKGAAVADIYDKDDLKFTSSVKKGDLVFLIDTDDDGAAYDYVVRIMEKGELPSEGNVTIDAIADASVTAGNTVTRTVSVTPANATVTAESSNKNVATVAVDGNKVTVNGVAAGTATITVTAEKSGYKTATKEFEVTVSAAGDADLIDNASINATTVSFGAWSTAISFNVIGSDIASVTVTDNNGETYTNPTINGSTYTFEKFVADEPTSITIVVTNNAGETETATKTVTKL